MATNDVSESALKLIDSGNISWPSNENNRHQFITESLGKLWDDLTEININANIEIFRYLDDKLAETSLYGKSEDASGLS